MAFVNQIVRYDQIIPATQSQLHSVTLRLIGGLCQGFALVLLAWHACNHLQGNIPGIKAVETTNWMILC